MYLIHVRLAHDPGGGLPQEAGSLITRCADPGEGLEHLVVHPAPPAGAIVGLFVTAADLDRAETVAENICRRAVTTVPQLRGLTVLSCGSPLLTGYYERLLAEGASGGRDRPRPESS
jgi:hypothetical protein